MADRQMGNVLSLPIVHEDNKGGGTENLLSENAASLETDVTDWTAGANTTVAQGAISRYGSSGLELTSDAAGDVSAQTDTGTDGVAVEADKEYTAVAFVQPTVSPRNSKIGIEWFTAAGASISEDTGAEVLSIDNEWVFVFVTASAPATAAFAAVRVTVEGTGAGAEVHNVDAVSLHRGNELVFQQGGSRDEQGFVDPDMLTVDRLRRKLKEIDSTYYTDAVLDSMLVNDMVYAIRLEDHPETV